MNEEPNNRSEINDAEVVDTLGNMLLVMVDGDMKQVPATEKNELLYKHNLYGLLRSGDKSERVVLTDDEDDGFIAVSPTENDSVYEIWIGDKTYPVMNPPSMSGNLLKAIRDALTNSDYSSIYEIYKKIREEKVRRSVINKVANNFPRSEVIPQNNGWNILGLFLITWDARIFLNTGSIENKKSYKVRGSGVSETEDVEPFLELSVSDHIIEKYKNLKMKVKQARPDMSMIDNENIQEKECPRCGKEESYLIDDGIKSNVQQDVEFGIQYVCKDDDCISWTEFDLTEREIEFIWKVKWLINHRNQLEDDTFWNVIESRVWRNSE